MEFLQDTTFIYITLAAVFGIFMAWGIGANDVANAMATSVGSKAITIKQAIIIAAIFEFLGAYLAGGQVTSTIRKGIVDLNAFEGNADLLIWGMLAALLAAGTWLLIASMRGWPVSTTHSIVGAVIGFAAVGVSMDAVSWDKVGTIVMSWVVSPLLAAAISFATLVGAILGVGLARGIAAIDLRVVGNIFMSWVVTLPAGAILSIIFFYILKAIFG